MATKQVGQTVSIDCHNIEDSRAHRVWRRAKIIGAHTFDQYPKLTLEILDGPCVGEIVVRSIEDCHAHTECSICRSVHGLEIQHACE